MSIRRQVILIATTKIWAVKDSLNRVVDYAKNPEKTESEDLKQVLHYTERKDKTLVGSEVTCFVSGVNCDKDIAFEEMLAIKNRFGKSGGNIAYHGYQSFKPGEITPEKAHEIGVQLATKLWGKQYQVLVATHLDKEHIHNHLVLNSVSFVKGKKFNDNLNAYYEMRRISDELCKENELSVIKNPKGHTPRSVYFAEKNGEPTRYNLMREAIDFAVAHSITMEQFNKVLYRKGYVIKADLNRKYPTIRSVNSQKATRMYHLGDEYLPNKIYEKVRSNPYQTQQKFYEYMYPERYIKPFYPKQYSVSNFKNAKKITGFRALYLHYCYLLGIIPKKNPNKPLSPEMREEWRKIKRYSNQVQLICRKKLNTEVDIKSFINTTTEQIKVVKKLRNGIYNKLRRCADEVEIATLKFKRDEYTTFLSVYRKNLKVANTVLEDVPKIKEKMKIELQMKADLQKSKEKKKERYR